MARVRRDEEAARKKEEEEEYRMQIADAEARVERLRRRMVGGETGRVEGHSKVLEDATMTPQGAEDEVLHSTSAMSRRDPQSNSSTSNLAERSGHFSLFPGRNEPVATRIPGESRRDITTQPAGDSLRPIGELAPWYTNVDKVGEKAAAKSAAQREREEKREERVKSEGDPLAMMKMFVRKTKDVEREREFAEKERRREMELVFGLEAESNMEKRTKKRDGTRERKRERRGERPRSRSRSPKRRKDRDKKSKDGRYAERAHREPHAGWGRKNESYDSELGHSLRRNNRSRGRSRSRSRSRSRDRNRRERSNRQGNRNDRSNQWNTFDRVDYGQHDSGRHSQSQHDSYKPNRRRGRSLERERRLD